MRISWPVAVVVLVSLAFGACTCRSCGRESDPVPVAVPSPRMGWVAKIPTAKPRDIARESGRLTPALPEKPSPPPVTPAEVKLPEDFPEDVPVFPDAKPFATQPLAGGARNVLFRSDAPNPAIFDYYKTEMRKQGYDLEGEYQTPEQSFLRLRKGRMLVQMTMTKDPRSGNSVVGIMYQLEEELPFPEF